MSDHDLSNIYLYKPPDAENFPNKWVYYRADSINRPDEPSGTMLRRSDLQGAVADVR